MTFRAGTAGGALAGMLAGTCLLAGCARRMDAAARRALASAQGPSGGSGERDRKGAGASADRDATGWTRAAAVVARARRALSSGEPSKVAALTERWCAVEPRPQPSPAGPVYVCVPDPPLVLGGVLFTFEIAPERGGLVSMVSADVSDGESERLARRARSALSAPCRAPFERAAQLANPHHEVMRCPLDGGVFLVVARLSKDLRRDLWQVSIALVGAT